MKPKLIITSLVAVVLVTGLAFAARAPKPVLGTPTLSCAADSTGASINITVTAASTASNGASVGAPAGFSVQWMTLADFTANGGWPDSSDVPSTNPNTPSFCKASFSGVPGCASNYSLAAGASVTVTVGDVLFDQCGASSPCSENPLLCGTTYVFRAFAHANSTYDRSPFSANATCSTLACPGGTGCTLTQGFWKTHYPDAWPDTGLGTYLGNRLYNDGELESIYEQVPAGNGLVTLAHQLITAKLNILNGADPTDANAAIAAADTLIGNLVVPPVGTGYLAPGDTSALVTTLTNYNEGKTGPGHCQ